MDRSDGTSRDPVAAAVRDPARRPAAPPCVRSAARRPLPGAHAAPAWVSGKLGRHESTGRRCSARGRIAVQLVSCRGDDRPIRLHVDDRHDGCRAGRDDRRRDVRRGSPDHGHPSRRSRRTARAGLRCDPRRRAGRAADRGAPHPAAGAARRRPLSGRLDEPGRRGSQHTRQCQRRRPQPQLPVQLGSDRCAGRLAVRRAGSGERAGDSGRRRASSPQCGQTS